ncbi:MAG: hypothetical protein WHS83_03730 [Chloroflexus sp.]|uniref:hypothetical protein n=1 Tax=Chloroflexus sp. TaxID=1904827 RepID=UPI0030ACF2D7
MLLDCRTGSRTFANRQRQHILLTIYQYGCEDGGQPSRNGLVALPARHTRVAAFGVRQPCCRASHAYDPVRGTPLTRLVTRMRCACHDPGVGR